MNIREVYSKFAYKDPLGEGGRGVWKLNEVPFKFDFTKPIHACFLFFQKYWPLRMENFT